MGGVGGEARGALTLGVVERSEAAGGLGSMGVVVGVGAHLAHAGGEAEVVGADEGGVQGLEVEDEDGVVVEAALGGVGVGVGWGGVRRVRRRRRREG